MHKNVFITKIQFVESRHPEQQFFENSLGSPTL